MLAAMIPLALLLMAGTTQAMTGYACTNNNLVTNITDTQTGVQYVWSTPCENGCMQSAGGTYVCVTTAFIIPMELFVLFEIIGFVFFTLSLIIQYGTENGNPLPFSFIAFIMFTALAMASFNLGGMTFLMGVAMNFGFGMFSLAFVILGALDMLPGKS